MIPFHRIPLKKRWGLFSPLFPGRHKPAGGIQNHLRFFLRHTAYHARWTDTIIIQYLSPLDNNTDQMVNKFQIIADSAIKNPPAKKVGGFSLKILSVCKYSAK